MIIGLITVLAATSASAAYKHDYPTVDELTFGRSLNGIIDGYRVSGLPLSDLGDAPKRFDHFARTHHQYSKSMTEVYAKRNATGQALYAADASFKAGQCSAARGKRQEAIATANRSAMKLDEAHARALAAEK